MVEAGNWLLVEPRQLLTETVRTTGLSVSSGSYEKDRAFRIVVGRSKMSQQEFQHVVPLILRKAVVRAATSQYRNNQQHLQCSRIRPSKLSIRVGLS